MIVVLKMIFNSSAPANVLPLAELQRGESAILGDFDLAEAVADHLMNLGLIPGTEVSVAQSGPGGDPRVYRVEGTEVALRRDIAACISVQLLPEKKTVSSPVLVLQPTNVSAD